MSRVFQSSDTCTVDRFLGLLIKNIPSHFDPKTKPDLLTMTYAYGWNGLEVRTYYCLSQKHYPGENSAWGVYATRSDEPFLSYCGGKGPTYEQLIEQYGKITEWAKERCIPLVIGKFGFFGAFASRVYGNSLREALSADPSPDNRSECATIADIVSVPWAIDGLRGYPGGDIPKASVSGEDRAREAVGEPHVYEDRYHLFSTIVLSLPPWDKKLKDRKMYSRIGEMTAEYALPLWLDLVQGPFANAAEEVAIVSVESSGGLAVVRRGNTILMCPLMDQEDIASRFERNIPHYVCTPESEVQYEYFARAANPWPGSHVLLSVH